MAALDPQFRPWVQYLIAVAQYNHLRVAVTSTLRTPQQQQLLYQRYLACQRRGGRCLPTAPPGSSGHERGLAVDLVVNGDYDGAAQAALGAFWRSLGFKWLGPSDPVHFSAV